MFRFIKPEADIAPYRMINASKIEYFHVVPSMAEDDLSAEVWVSVNGEDLRVSAHDSIEEARDHMRDLVAELEGLDT